MSSQSRVCRHLRRLSLRGARGVAILVGTFDLLAIALALLLAATIEGVALDIADAMPATYLVLGIAATWMLTLKLHGAYVAPCVRGSRATVQSVVPGSLSGAALVAAATWAVELEVAKTYLALGFALGASLLFVARWASCTLVRHWWARGRLERRVVVIGEPTPVGDVSVDLMRDERLSGLHVAGTGVHGGSGPSVYTGSIPVLESVADVVTRCREAGADAALVAGNWGSAEEMRRLSWEVADEGIDLFVAPDATEIGYVRMKLLPTAGLPLLHVDKPRVAEAGGVAKRVVDVVLSSAAVVLLAPVVLVITMLIKHEDHGPVYYRQTRLGRQGHPFTLLKFRTMEVGAGELEADMRREQGHEGPLWKMEGDPRITRVGQVLRRTSLDELPQFLNVLVGQMSLVGPRPQQQWEGDTYTSAAQRRLLVRPGITGLWQVSGRSELSQEESVRLDLFYVDNWSMASDLSILGQTANAVLSGRGAC